MTLLEWRKNGERRSLAMDMLSQPTMREILAVMDTEHPGKQAVALRDGFEASIYSGRVQGFQMAMDMLKSFAQPIPQPNEQVPITWNVQPPPKE